jgi:hypothetical protein
VAVHIGHRAENVGDAELVIVSSAVPARNPEVVAAFAAGIGVHKRAEALGALMAGSVGVAVAGTHGKTTTTAMIAHTLVAAGLEPSFIIGGGWRAWAPTCPPRPRAALRDRGRRVRPHLPWACAAAWRGHQRRHDHPDIFPTMDGYVTAFRRFVELPPEGAPGPLCRRPQARALARLRGRREVSVDSYGLARSGGRASLEARAVRLDPAGGSELEVWRDGERLATLRLRLPGRHNALNALAAWAVCTHLGVPPVLVAEALASFDGVARRFQLVGEAGGVTVIDDYAHHPTEIRAVLTATRTGFGAAGCGQCGSRIQPHPPAAGRVQRPRSPPTRWSSSTFTPAGSHPPTRSPPPTWCGDGAPGRDPHRRPPRRHDHLLAPRPSATSCSRSSRDGDAVGHGAGWARAPLGQGDGVRSLPPLALPGFEPGTMVTSEVVRYREALRTAYGPERK